MSTQTAPETRDGFVHEGLFYDSDDEYRTAVLEFVREGLAAGEPTLIAVPEPKLDLLREDLGSDADRVTFTDMSELGRNPARIIPTVRDFVDAHPDRRVRFVGEPIWSTRSAAETREATRHEALINVAFADTRMAVLCPYDITQLDPAVLADAECTHPSVADGGGKRASRTYFGTAGLPSSCDQPLPAPPRGAHTFVFLATGDLAAIRAFAADHATQAGLSADRADEIVLAVSELTANTLRHTGEGGTLRAWREADRLLYQVEDTGRIADPLADRRLPTPGVADSRGLWVVNQVCDLVELRSTESGSTIRLHVVAEEPSAPASRPRAAGDTASR